MDKQLFNDLLNATQEMVNIEQGKQTATIMREYDRPNTKAIRTQLGLKQDEFAKAIGVSTSLVQSWEQNRRYPDGAPLKILRLLEKKPEYISELQAI